MNWSSALKDKFSLNGWVRDVLATSVGGVALAMVWQYFEVIKSQPEILTKWGPSFLISLMVIVVVAVLFSQFIQGFSAAMNKVADNAASMAQAMQQIADKDDRQFEETKRMSQYSAMKSDRAVELIEEQNKMLGEFIAECRVQRGSNGAG